MKPEQREQLKPCPFCGGPVTLERAMRIGEMGARDWWGVKCRNTMNLGGTCAIEQIPSGSAEAAIERWNRRAQVEALTVPKWISVDTEPDNDTAVIVLFWPYGNQENIQVAQSARYFDGSFIDDDGNEMHPPSHWMPFVFPTIPAIPGMKEGA